MPEDNQLLLNVTSILLYKPSDFLIKTALKKKKDMNTVNIDTMRRIAKV